MLGVLDHAPGLLPENRPRYSMGWASPTTSWARCCAGSTCSTLRAADPVRGGPAELTRRGAVNIKECPPCRGSAPARPRLRLPGLRGLAASPISHHVFKAGDHRGDAADWHNLHYYQDLMRASRAAIAEGGSVDYVAGFEAERAAETPEPV